MQINLAKKFKKRYEKVDTKIKTAFDRRFELFQEDPLHSQLKNHKLTGKLAGYKSINITGDWRAIYSESEDENGEKIVIFEILGTHSELYG